MFRFARSTAHAVFVIGAMFLLAACGGSGSTDETEGGGGVGTDGVTISGAESLTVSAPGGCGPHDFEPGAWNAMFTTDGDEPWLLDVTIVTFEAPKTYETAPQDESGKATIFLTNGAGTTYDTTDSSGSFTVETGGLSGSMDVTLTNAEDNSTVTVAGGFSDCEDLSR